MDTIKRATADISKRYDKLDSERTSRLKVIRRCSALSKTGILPGENVTPDKEITQAFQTIGQRGVNALTGKLMRYTFPIDRMWLRFTLAPELRYSARLKRNPAMLQELEQAFFRAELTIQSSLETVRVDHPFRQGRTPFHSGQRTSLDYIAVAGESLEHMNDDLRIRHFRPDSYVTQRDGYTDVLFHITREMHDPLELTDAQLSAVDIKREDEKDKAIAERLRPLHTIVERQPLTHTWVIRQELAGKRLPMVSYDKKLVEESQEEVSPYFCAGYEILPGENYHRGFIESVLGDLRSLDNLRERMMDFAAMCSRWLIVRDRGSSIRPSDLELPSGSVINNGKVDGGNVNDVGLLRMDKVADFSVVERVHNSIKEDLSKAMLLASDSVRHAERTTALEVEKATLADLDNATSGLATSIMERKTLPMYARVKHVLERERMIPTLKDGVELRAMTGIASFSREIDNGKLMRALQQIIEIAKINPQQAQRINVGVLTDIVLRQNGVEEPGIITSVEEAEAAMEREMARQAKLGAAQEAVKGVRGIAEAQLENQAA